MAAFQSNITCFSFLSLPTRCDSWSNSDRSLEQTSFDDVFVDGLQPPPSSNLVHPSRHGNGSQEASSMRSQAIVIWNREINGPSRDHLSASSLLETSLNSTIQVGKSQVSLPCAAKELDVSNTPPPRPPKPSHFSERRQEEQQLWSGHSNSKKPECTLVPRRISLSGLDHMRTWKGKSQMLSFRYREKPGQVLPCLAPLRTCVHRRAFPMFLAQTSLCLLMEALAEVHS